MPNYDPNRIKKFAAEWTAAGLDPTPIADVVDRMTTHLDRLKAERADATTTDRRALVDRVATGDLTLLDAIRLENTVGAATESQQHRIQALYRRAVELVTRTATVALTTMSETLITDHLAPAHDAIVAEVPALAAKAAGIHDDRSAIAAPPDARDAWGQLHDLALRRSALLAIVQTMLSVGILTNPGKVEHEHRRLARPDLKPFGLGRAHPAHQLIALIRAGTEPGIYSSEQMALDAATVASIHRAPDSQPKGSYVDQWIAANA